MAERGQIGKRSRAAGEASTPNGSNLTASTVAPASTANDDSSREVFTDMTYWKYKKADENDDMICDPNPYIALGRPS